MVESLKINKEIKTPIKGSGLGGGFFSSELIRCNLQKVEGAG